MFRQRSTKGQAIVEFSLAATLIFFLLVAAIDLGLIFFTLQGLNNAAQEGATYGSRWLTGPTGAARVDEDTIRERVRLEAGDQGGIGFVNLLDLNNNGIPDVAPGSGVKEINADTGNAVIDDYIEILVWADIDLDGNPIPDATSCYDTSVSPGGDLAKRGYPCYLQVIVHADYNFVFPLAPAFADEVNIGSPFIVLLRG